jgi:hypothetical protein
MVTGPLELLDVELPPLLQAVSANAINPVAIPSNQRLFIMIPSIIALCHGQAR